MVRLYFLIGGLVCFGLAESFAQSWTGNGDGTSWGDGNNWSTNSIPSSSSLVEIHNDTVVVDDQFLIQRLTLDSATLIIDQNSGLTIKGSDSNALDLIQSNVINRGLLTVRNFSVFGIRLEGGDIIIESTGILKVRVGGNFGIDLREGSLINAGEVEITDAEVGISNRGGIVNDGQFLIDQVKHIGIDQRDGSTKNCFGGQLSIVADTTILRTVIGMDLAGRLINQGALELTSCHNIAIGLRNDTLINEGSIIFKDHRSGIFAGVGSSMSMIENKVGGTLSFQNPNTSNPNSAIKTTGTLNNYGLVELIGYSDFGIILDEPALLNNYGRMISAGPWEADFITNEGNVVNHVEGEMIMSSTGTPDFGIINAGGFINQGDIVIDMPRSQGSSIASGFVPGTSFVNSGDITITGGSRGISTRHTDTLTNTAAGRIFIENSRIGIRTKDNAFLRTKI